MTGLSTSFIRSSTRTASLPTQGDNLSPGYLLSLSCEQDSDLSGCRRLAAMFHIVIVKSGSCCLETNGSTYVLFPGSAVCLNNKGDFRFTRPDRVAADIVRFRPESVNSRLTLNSLFTKPRRLSPTDIHDRRLLEPFLQRASASGGVLTFGPASFGRLTASAAALHRALARRDTDCWPCLSRSHLIEILSLLFCVFHSDGEASVAIPEGDDAFTELLRHVHAHFREKLSVDGMVRLLNTNRTTFSALFKRHTGGSFLSYLIRLRVGKAAVLLRETELPVKEILYQTGFTDPTHFSRCFKKITGLNPGAYRASRRRPVTQIPGGRETGLIAAG